MEKKIFGGLVTVYITEPNILNDYKKVVEINWSAIGSSSIERTEQFIASMNEAVEYAKEMSK
jgi:hypothetical protein